MKNKMDGDSISASKTLTEEAFAERLKSIRNAKNYTQKQLAEAIGITPATLSAYENGTKVPVLTTAAEIAKKCGVTLDWLCGFDGVRKEREDITYSDIIKNLIQLNELVEIEVSATVKKYWKQLDPLSSKDAHERVGVIDIRNYVIAEFIEEWVKVKALYDEGTISKSLYDPWVAQQLIDFDCPLSEIPQKLELPF